MLCTSGTDSCVVRYKRLPQLHVQNNVVHKLSQVNAAPKSLACLAHATIMDMGHSEMLSLAHPYR